MLQSPLLIGDSRKEVAIPATKTCNQKFITGNWQGRDRNKREGGCSWTDKVNTCELPPSNLLINCKCVQALEEERFKRLTYSYEVRVYLLCEKPPAVFFGGCGQKNC